MTSDSPEQTAPADRSMLWVAAGLGVFGLANFVFLALVGRDLGPAGSAPVSVAWTILNAVGIGLFQPLEQETSRKLSAAGVHGRTGAHLGRMTRYATGAGIVIVLVGAAGFPWIGDALFGGARQIVLVVVLGLLGQGLAYFARGVLAGKRKFHRYGSQLGLDGVVRTAAAAALFVSGTGTQLTYGLILVIAPVAATVLAITLGELVRVWRDRDGSDAGNQMTSLVLSSTASQLLANLGPIAIALLVTTSEQGVSGRFIAAVTVARIPLFLFAAIQAVFLPALAALVAARQVGAFLSTTRRAFAATVALAVLGVAGIAVLGHWVMRLIYGAEFTIGTAPLVLVAVSGGLFMLAQVLAQALLAHHGESAAAWGWFLGLAAACLALALPGDVSTTVALALCIGSAVSLAVLGAFLFHQVRRWRRALQEVHG